MFYLKDITSQEIFGLALVFTVPSVIGYLFGRHIHRTRIGFLLAILWIPSCLLFCPPTARAAIVGITLLSFLPIIISFTVGVARKPLNEHDRNV
jgi:hypothetical protein